jgi:acyl-CoA-dependent ceramide synthase
MRHHAQGDPTESSFKLMIIPPILYTTWQLFAPYFGQDLSNPFRPLLFVSHPVASSPPGDQRYEKGYLDLVLFAYHIVVWSFVRQFITVNVARRLGRMVGIKKAAKLDRFGEQFYAVVYFTFFATWGTVKFSLDSLV